ncbi:MAG TPA: YbhB/YbcL family Raf kinase inhibitor-like protein, partial [Gammaproteobacteria bacterium]|nr:YbhB/YbcL family Raf kinase inhibitor-like protein [Gammaproteobacteria bacterium]
MQLSINNITDGQPIAAKFAFCVPDPQTHVTFAPNRNPAISWRDVPSGTKSLVLLCVDVDAPSKPDDVNKDDREVPADLPRADFYHWVMVDIPPTVMQIEEAACADGVVPHGKQLPAGPAQTRQGLNDYTGWFSGDKDMAGNYY